MKNMLFMLSILVAFFSCGQPTQVAEEQTESPEKVSLVDQEMTSADQMWEAAKEDFHEVMAATFHPAEGDDLAPVKERYNDLIEMSAKWAALDIPDKHQDQGLEDLLMKLQNGSADMATVVQQGSDEEVKKAIFDLHDVFHEIVGACDH